MEWALLWDIGLVGEDSPVVACVHDVQFVDEDLESRETDTLVDWVLTPTRTIRIEHRSEKPGGIRWDLLDPQLLATIPPLQELRAVRTR